jgi:hypothetical protein
MKKIIYLLTAGAGGAWLGKIIYTIYAYLQLVTVRDIEVDGLLGYQLVGFIIGVAIGRYWQTHYRYWSSMSFMPKPVRK